MKTWLESNMLKKYRFMESKFLENKDHFIDKLDLTLDQKEELKAFFAKHPSYESKIDWNNKSLSYKDFEPLLALDGKSKTQAKKYDLVGLVEEKDYVDLGKLTLKILDVAIFISHLLIWDQQSSLQTESLLQRVTVLSGASLIRRIMNIGMPTLKKESNSSLYSQDIQNMH